MTLFNECLFEFIGTMVLILLGDGVVACTTLEKSKGKGAGWIVITMGWGFAVMCGAFIAGPFTGAHLNPAVSIGLAIAGKFAWNKVLAYSVAQILGGLTGGILVYTFYKDHFDATQDTDTKLGCFCTIPAIRHKGRNLLCETIGTALLVFVILALSVRQNASPDAGSLGFFPITMVIMSIGMSLGGTTGYAINPARDLGPRLAHALLPIKGKSHSDWSYSWVPVLGPVIGSAIAAALFLALYPAV